MCLKEKSKVNVLSEENQSECESGQEKREVNALNGQDKGRVSVLL